MSTISLGGIVLPAPPEFGMVGAGADHSSQHAERNDAGGCTITKRRGSRRGH
jgi:hypothetical protein